MVHFVEGANREGVPAIAKHKPHKDRSTLRFRGGGSLNRFRLDAQ